VPLPHISGDTRFAPRLGALELVRRTCALRYQNDPRYDKREGCKRAAPGAFLAAALETARLDPAASVEDIDRLIAAQLELPLVVSRIAANRMSVTWTQGLILNVATLAGRPGGTRQAFATLAKSTLVDMTRAQAEEWAGRGIRINAVAPETALGEPGARLYGEADVASLALYLASDKAKTLSGCVFEAAP